MEAATAAPPRSSSASESSSRAGTRYVVLAVAKKDGETVLIPVGEHEGRTDVKAIEAAAKANGIEDGQFVAVPVRQFRPRTLKIERSVKLNIS